MFRATGGEVFRRAFVRADHEAGFPIGCPGETQSTRGQNAQELPMATGLPAAFGEREVCFRPVREP